MKKLLSLIMLINISLHAYTSDIVGKQEKYKFMDRQEYGWLPKHNKFMLFIDAHGEARNIMTKDDIERYVKLKMRNFVGKIKFIQKAENFDYGYFSIIVSLNKYNKNSTIHYGLVELKISKSLNYKEPGLDTKQYRLTKEIAGSRSQIKNFIKEDLDWMIEQFADSYYYMKDLDK